MTAEIASKNLLLDHNCDKCEHRNKYKNRCIYEEYKIEYGTCFNWDEDSLYTNNYKNGEMV